jgi:hypothetical protein
MRMQHVKARLACLAHYNGGKCFCCEENKDAFLLICDDNNRGLTSNQMLEASKNLPPNLHVSCYNCHYARKLWGDCPHLHPFRSGEGS